MRNDCKSCFEWLNSVLSLFTTIPVNEIAGISFDVTIFAPTLSPV
jgi:hypothetical protein